MPATRRVNPGHGIGLIGALIAAAGAIALALWWTRPPTTALTAAQVLALLPAGSTLHSLARVDLDGALPVDAAAVIGIPQFPGAPSVEYFEMIAGYDRWQRRYTVIHRQPLSRVIPISVDAGRILGDREGVLFQALRDDGRWSFRVVGVAAGRVAVLAQGESTGRITLSDPLVIKRGEAQALVWDGTRFAVGALPAVSPPPGALTWRYTMRNGTVAARTSQVVLRPRQTLRILAVGGGTTPIVIADPRLDVVENGFRARQEGVYSIRVLAPYTPTENAYVLTVIVTAGTPP